MHEYHGYSADLLRVIAAIMHRERVDPIEALEILNDASRLTEIILAEQMENVEPKKIVIERYTELPVRCSECKYYLGSSEKCELIDTRLNFFATGKVWTEICYCAWGERKDGEQDG